MKYSETFKSETNWLDPLNRIAFQQAFKSKAEQVTLRDGRVFIISYPPMGTKIKVEPQHGLVPMGTFDLSVVTDPMWLISETGYTG